MKRRRRMKGTVAKVVKPINGEPEKAQIHVEEAEELYREIRVENEVADETGDKAKLKPGAQVDVVIEADPTATVKKSGS